MRIQAVQHFCTNFKEHKLTSRLRHFLPMVVPLVQPTTPTTSSIPPVTFIPSSSIDKKFHFYKGAVVVSFIALGILAGGSLAFTAHPQTQRAPILRHKVARQLENEGDEVGLPYNYPGNPVDGVEFEVTAGDGFVLKKNSSPGPANLFPHIIPQVLLTSSHKSGSEDVCEKRKSLSEQVGQYCYNATLPVQSTRTASKGLGQVFQRVDDSDELHQTSSTSNSDDEQIQQLVSEEYHVQDIYGDTREWFENEEDTYGDSREASELVKKFRHNSINSKQGSTGPIIRQLT